MLKISLFASNGARALGAAVGRVCDRTLELMELLVLLFDPAHAEHAGEGLLPHSSSLTTQRDNTRQIHRTHSWFVDEGGPLRTP